MNDSMQAPALKRPEVTTDVAHASSNFGDVNGEKKLPSKAAAALLSILKSFTRLSADWDGHSAKPMSDEMFRRAHAAILAFDHRDFLPREVAASSDGGFTVYFHHARLIIELHVDEDSWEWSVAGPGGFKFYNEQPCVQDGDAGFCAAALVDSARGVPA